MRIPKKNALYQILNRINACEFSNSNKVVFTSLNCFTLKSSVGGICGRELEIIGPFKGAAILLQCSVYDISKYQIGETVSLGRFDCLSSWRFEFSTGLFPRSSQTPRAPRRGGGGRGQLGLAPPPPPRAGRSRRPAARAPQAPAPGGSSACSAGARPGCAAEAGAPGGRALCHLAARCRPMTRRFPLAAPQSVGPQGQHGVAPNSPA